VAPPGVGMTILNLEKLRITKAKNKPFEYIVCENIVNDTEKFLATYDFFTLSKAWKTEQTTQQFMLHEFDKNSEAIVNELNDFDWKTYLSEELNINFNQFNCAFQGTNLNKPFGKHTDEPEITGVLAKFLIYMTPEINCGTQLHGDSTIVTPGRMGDIFIFKTSKDSWHSTDYSDLELDTKRILLIGTFHA